MEKILIVVDMQNDFIDGALGTEEAKVVVGKILKKLNNEKYSKVFATRDTHYDNYLSTHEGINLPIPHCIKGTRGWNINNEIQELLNDNNAEIIDKPGFGSTELINKLTLEYENNNEVIFEFVGLCTDICVATNVMMLRGALTEAEIIVDEKCCAGVTPKSHREALETMKMCHIEIK